MCNQKSMYVNVRQFSKVYEKVLAMSSSHSSCQLAIFVSCLNIDALCATKMLSRLLKSQLVQLQIVPVFGYSDLLEHYSKLDENINTVFLIGCGGMIDLESFFEVDASEDETSKDNETTGSSNEFESVPNGDGSGKKKSTQNQGPKRFVYVLDTHRPWNLDNIFGSTMVTCFDDNTIDDELQDEKKAYYRLLELDEEMGSDDEDSDDDDDDDDELKDNKDIEDDDDDDEEGESNPSKRRIDQDYLQKQKRKKQKKEFHILQNQIQKYYTQGGKISNSLSVQVYSLVSALGETNLSFLWLTILGATSLDFLYPEVYQKLYPLLADEVKRLSTSETNSVSNVKTPDTLKITIERDYHLYLLRFSTLYDSFLFSNYVNAKLTLWHENGKRKLHKMFARMGISLIEAQKNWLYMNNDIKKELGNIFQRNLDAYGLDDIVKNGFIRTSGYRGSISANEFLEGINALLEVNLKSGLTDVLGNDAFGGQYSQDQNSILVGDERPINEVLKERSRKWVSNFWQSWDALDDKQMRKLNKGIEFAQILQKSVFETGVAVLEKRLIKNLRIYRLCVLQDVPDLALYKNPITLLRLGNWLLDCCSESSDDKSLLPLVLAAFDPTTDTYLCTGMAPKYPRGLALQKKEPLLNNFTVAFQLIANETGAKVRIDNFETSIIEIRKEDLSPFLERLTLSGLI